MPMLWKRRSLLESSKTFLSLLQFVLGKSYVQVVGFAPECTIRIWSLLPPAGSGCSSRLWHSTAVSWEKAASKELGEKELGELPQFLWELLKPSGLSCVEDKLHLTVHPPILSWFPCLLPHPSLPEESRTPGWPWPPNLPCPPCLGAMGHWEAPAALFFPSAKPFSCFSLREQEQPAPTTPSFLMQGKSCLQQQFLFPTIILTGIAGIPCLFKPFLLPSECCTHLIPSHHVY